MTGKFKAALLLVVMFGLGVASGVALRTYQFHRYRSPHAMFTERRVKRLTAQLNLTAAQQQALRDIFQKAHDRASQVNEEVSWDLADIHRDSVKAIREILTPEQKIQFEKLHARFHARHSHMAADDIEESSGTARPIHS